MDQINKKVVYIVTKSNWGGAQKNVSLLANYSHQQVGWEAVVIHGRSEILDKNLFTERLDSLGISRYEVPSMGRNISLLGEISSFKTIYSILRRIQPDAVNLNSPKAGGLGGLAARLIGVPTIVYTARGLSFFEDRPWWQLQIIKFISWLTFLLATKVIILSDRELEVVRNWPLCKNKFIKIYNGVGDMELLSQKEARRELDYLAQVDWKRGVVLGNIAELTPNKGISYLLDSLAALKKQGKKFIYIHFGAGVLEEELKEKARRLDLEQSVIWLGFIPNAGRLLTALDILVFPSVKEGLPNVVLEAGYLGIPVVTTNAGGIEEIVRHEQEGLVVSIKNTPALQDAISIMMSDTNKRMEYGRALQTRVRELFSLTHMLSQTHDLYE